MIRNAKHEDCWRCIVIAQCTRWMIRNMYKTWIMNRNIKSYMHMYVSESTSWHDIVVGNSWISDDKRRRFALNKVSAFNEQSFIFIFRSVLFIYCMNINSKFTPCMAQERCYWNCFWRIFMTGNNFLYIHLIALPLPWTIVDHRRWIAFIVQTFFFLLKSYNILHWMSLAQPLNNLSLA